MTSSRFVRLIVLVVVALFAVFVVGQELEQRPQTHHVHELHPSLIRIRLRRLSSRPPRHLQTNFLISRRTGPQDGGTFGILRRRNIYGTRGQGAQTSQSGKFGGALFGKSSNPWLGAPRTTWH
eukprot:GHVS01071254.1.p1 GENE.GHVS01071254.1~~GHVS01071254.1.p1  ORF type:complete len:123 (-),score=5.27 GHVS01071254.1:354-722(-)